MIFKARATFDANEVECLLFAFERLVDEVERNTTLEWNKEYVKAIKSTHKKLLRMRESVEGSEEKEKLEMEQKGDEIEYEFEDTIEP